jgi:hypothetical protein
MIYYISTEVPKSMSNDAGYAEVLLNDIAVSQMQRAGRGCVLIHRQSVVTFEGYDRSKIWKFRSLDYRHCHFSTLSKSIITMRKQTPVCN